MAGEHGRAPPVSADGGLRRTAAAIMLFAVALGLAPAAAAADKAGKKGQEATIELIEQKLEERLVPLEEGLQGRFEQQGQGIGALRDVLDRMSQGVRANAKSIEDLKAKLEENSIRVYERLSAEKNLVERLEALSARLAADKSSRAGHAGGRRTAPGAPNPAPQASSPSVSGAQPAIKVQAAGTARDAVLRPETAPAAVEPYDGATARLLVATLLAFAVGLGLTLLETPQLQPWAVSHAALRNFAVAAVLILAYFTIGFGGLFGEADPVSGGEPADAGLAADVADALRLYRLGLVVVGGLIVSTIVSDRVSLPGAVVLALVLGAVAYPVLGLWSVSGPGLSRHSGWLEELGFVDFAGATTLHSFAAWVALAWTRAFPVGRGFEPEGSAVRPHVSPVLFGLLIVWAGWFGLILGHQALEEPRSAFLVLNTLLAGATGLTVSLTYWVGARRGAGVGETYAGIAAGTLSGLVAISAAVDAVAPVEAMVIGGGAALLQPIASRLLAERVVREDRVAANLIAAHGVCGIWGTLCVGLFGTAGVFGFPDAGRIGIQAVGVTAVLGFGAAMGVLGVLGYRGLSRLRGVALEP
ncbi:hypothetical protein sS8_1931 [Methylocaldum marinum]|uniref:Ammonium transporter AmtB-like domain-containing protein n=1 Tax=Methylocaldum marinum TaxID=1432792 RepID=A0A250KQE1_9GAMM|nr:hypothetical protein [Methylocaldum marinum]BBA33885.1 hypothetical protein sS8_1931 [Methylocaldum marinum]